MPVAGPSICELNQLLTNTPQAHSTSTAALSRARVPKARQSRSPSGHHLATEHSGRLLAQVRAAAALHLGLPLCIPVGDAGHLGTVDAVEVLLGDLGDLLEEAVGRLK